MLFWGLILSSLASCSTKEDMIVDKIVEFQSCLQTKPQKLKGKICNAYVSLYEEEIPELLDCLQKKKIKAIDYEKNNHGTIFEINVSFSCSSGRRFAVRFEKLEYKEKYKIAWVGEIVY